MEKDLKIQDLLDEIAYFGPLQTAKPQDTLHDAMKNMRSKRVTSLPVLEGREGEESCLGRIDALDVARHFAESEMNRELNLKVGTFLKAYEHARDPQNCLILPADTRAEDALRAFAGGWKHVLVRVQVRGKYILQNLSATDFAKFFFYREERVPDSLWEQKMRNIVDTDENIVTVREKDSAFDALNTLVQSKVGAVPIVDDDGYLLTSFSASDLRGFSPRKLRTIERVDIGTFLKQMRPGERYKKPIVVELEDNLRETMRRMVLSGIHQVWVTEDTKTNIRASYTLNCFLSTLLLSPETE